MSNHITDNLARREIYEFSDTVHDESAMSLSATTPRQDGVTSFPWGKSTRRHHAGTGLAVTVDVTDLRFDLDVYLAFDPAQMIGLPRIIEGQVGVRRIPFAGARVLCL